MKKKLNFSRLKIYHTDIPAMTSETQILNTIDTGHEDIINDAVLDYFGTTLATAANDGKIKLFDVRNGQQRQIEVFSDHTGPIWQIAWAHPSFGDILASCSYDGDVILYKKEPSTQKWGVFYKEKFPKAVNSVCWAPVEFGLILAVACSNENIYIWSFKNGACEKKTIINAHNIASKAVSFAPGNTPSSLFTEGSSDQTAGALRLVSGGDENEAKIWRFDRYSDTWIEEDNLEAHEDWIKDVAWAPNIGLPEEQIATCSTDHKVIIWSRNHLDTNSSEKNSGGKSSEATLENLNELARKTWKPTVLPPFDEVISHVSWSLTGGILACSGGVDHISLWKQDLSGCWQRINDVNDEPVKNSQGSIPGGDMQQVNS